MNFLGSLTSSSRIHEWVKKNVMLMALVGVIAFFLSFCFVALNDYLQFKIAHMLLAKQHSFVPDSYNHNLFQLILTLGRIFSHATEMPFIRSWTIVFVYSICPTIKQVFTPVDGLIVTRMTLFSNILKIWARPFITMSHVSCILFCYSVSVTAVAAAPLLVFSNPNVAALLVAFLVGVTGSIFYLYFLAPWILTVFDSVVAQGSYELEAIQKGEAATEGKMGILSLLLNIFGYVFVVGLFKSYEMKEGTDLFSDIYYWVLLIETVGVDRTDKLPM